MGGGFGFGLENNESVEITIVKDLHIRGDQAKSLKHIFSYGKQN